MFFVQWWRSDLAVGGKDAVGFEIVFVEVVVVVLVLLAVVIVIVIVIVIIIVIIIEVGAAIASGRWLRHGVCRLSFVV